MAHSAGRVHNERHLKKSLDEELSMTVKKYDDNDAAPNHPPTLPYSIFIRMPSCWLQSAEEARNMIF